jgi:hypothetical protein
MISEGRISFDGDPERTLKIGQLNPDETTFMFGPFPQMKMLDTLVVTWRDSAKADHRAVINVQDRIKEKLHTRAHEYVVNIKEDGTVDSSAVEN